MAEATQVAQPGAALAQERGSESTFSRVAKYMGVRLVFLFFTIVIGVYLTIIIANMGGYVDQIRRGVIREQVGLQVLEDPTFRQLSQEQREALIADMIRVEEERIGLNRPFIVRSFGFLKDALTLNLGRAEQMTSDSGSRQVKLILLERLPATLVMWGFSNLIRRSQSGFCIKENPARLMRLGSSKT